MEADYIARFRVENTKPEKVVFQVTSQPPARVKFYTPKEQQIKVVVGSKGVLSAGRSFAN